jgi:hypothetical protein
MNNVDSVREETKKHLGDKADLSYITQDLIDTHKNAKKLDELAGTKWVRQGNSIHVSGTNWYWNQGADGNACGAVTYYWPAQLDVRPLGRCANGAQTFTITPR